MTSDIFRVIKLHPVEDEQMFQYLETVLYVLINRPMKINRFSKNFYFDQLDDLTRCNSSEIQSQQAFIEIT